jgi:3-hydroxy-9,10-secoandrosta-1,3,5(10)-triene-9,17-dione monooxygenase
VRAVLRKRQPECEALGCVPDETNRACMDRGFYRDLATQTLRWPRARSDDVLPGYGEHHPRLSSSGRVLALTAGPAHLLSVLFSEQAQQEIFGPDGEYHAPASLNGSASAVPVAGG